MNFLKQAGYIGFVVAKLLICQNQATFRLVSRLRSFVNFFGKNFDFVKLHQLAKFNYQTVFTSQIIH